MIADSTLALLTATAVNKSFQAGIAKATVNTTPLFAEIPSSTEFNTYAWLEAYTKMREWVGERVFRKLKARQFPVYNKTYENSFAIKREKLEDANGLFTDQIFVESLGDSAAKLKDDLGVDLLQNGHSRVCLDGQYFFDTDHPIDIDNAGAGTQQNYWASGMALTDANLDTVCSAIATMKAPDGRMLGAKATHLIIPTQLRSTAKKILTAEKNSNGADNVYKDMLQIIEIPELSNQATTWYVADLSKPIKGLVFQNRRAAAIAIQNDPRSPSVFYRNQLEFGADCRVGAGYGPYWLMAKAAA